MPGESKDEEYKKTLDTFLEINIFKGFGHILRPLLLLYYEAKKNFIFRHI